jgi:Polyketide synthase dehydratase/KR domain
VESFDRVFDTKTRSAFVLSRHVRPESLRFAIFFSSVAGRFGNRGQTDYAAANEVVNKLAADLSRRWPARVCSINWAPWDKRGMVSPELKREFAQRGIELIDPVAGRRAFWEEIQQLPGGRAEIVVAASVRASLAPAGSHPPEARPLLDHAVSGSAPGGVVVHRRTLDPTVDWYLDDHRLDGRGVLPLAFATELMAEAAQSSFPELTVVAVRNLQLLKGITVGDAPVALEIVSRMPVHVSEGLVTTVDVEIQTPSQLPPLRYRAAVDLAFRAETVPPFQAGDNRLAPLALSLDAAYNRWTFHGPLFRRLTGIDGLGPDAIRGGIHSSSATPGLRDVRCAGWIIDPFVFDAALQMLLIWSRAQNDKTALPSRFRAFRSFGALSDVPLTCHVQVESIAGGHAIRSDVHFVGPDGAVLGILEGMEASCSADLNRLVSPLHS